MKKYSLSVIIPCRNEKNNIEETLSCVYNSSLEDIDLEVFVVDGMSNDGTRELIQKLQKEYKGLEMINNPAQTTPQAFNLGIQAGTSDYFVIVGGRHQVDKHYFIRCLKAFDQDSSIRCVGGKSIAVATDAKSEAIAEAMKHSFGMGAGNFRTQQESGFVDTIGTPMYRRSIVEELGYFNELLIRNQDDEYNYRLKIAGYKVWMQASAEVKYVVRANYMQLFKQFYQYGYWKVFVNQLHRNVTTLRQLVPALFVSYLLMTIVLLSINFALFKGLLLGLFLYLAAGLTAAFQLSTRPRTILQIMRAFICLHFGYGFGYIDGLWTFLLLRRKPKTAMAKLTR